MMATRRLGRTHHEFRFGRRELVVLGAVFCLIASLVFAAGIVVGREMARGKGAARADATREHRLSEPEEDCAEARRRSRPRPRGRRRRSPSTGR